MLQHLWKLKIGWDSTIPEDVANRWITHCDQLKNIDQISIPQPVLAQSPQNVQVHGFSDASEVAYGACIYLRSVNLDGSIMVRLLCARSRVAPIKSLSLPRLELCGALTLANLYEKVKGSIRVDVEESYFWSDSMITLAWIKGEPSRWHTFVGNRVSEIQQTIPSEKWNHVKSEENPADLISRGTSLNDLVDSDLWWNGPIWLSKEKTDWPRRDVSITQVSEERKLELAFMAILKDFSILTRFSSWNKLCRVIATCFRFVNNCMRKKGESTAIIGSLSAEELKKASTTLLRLHQKEEFWKEMQDLQQGKQISSSSKLLTLNPFLDKEGLIRPPELLSYLTVET